MKTIHSARSMARELARLRKKGATVGFVPTMGFLHEGHLSLIRRARKDTDIVVVSIFVNPVQFGPREDYRRYPRDMRHDKRMCLREKVDYILYPGLKQMYPEGYSTYVEVQGLTSNLCGKFRPGHFRGVATIVMKLLNIVRPDKVYVGQKDAQQAIVIKRLAADLDTGARVVIVPTVREKDGLAMSSRNTYLSAAERGLAPTIYRALQEARLLIKSGNKDAHRIISKIRGQIINTVDGIDYISIVDTKDLVDIKRIEGEVLVAVAVWFGKTRLIDNIIVRP